MHAKDLSDIQTKAHVHIVHVIDIIHTNGGAQDVPDITQAYACMYLDHIHQAQIISETLEVKLEDRRAGKEANAFPSCLATEMIGEICVVAVQDLRLNIPALQMCTRVPQIPARSTTSTKTLPSVTHLETDPTQAYTSSEMLQCLGDLEHPIADHSKLLSS